MPHSLSLPLTGFSTGFALIVAIGSQNAMLLRQGLMRRHVLVLAAMAASLVWFTALSFGARLLAPLFAPPITWRILDCAVGLTMIVIGVHLPLS